jgi:mycofactocin radical SAM maturase
LKQQWIHEGLSAPVNVTWEVTNQCNLSCIHCLSGSGRAKENELTFDQCLGLIDQLAEHKVFQVNFGGGEPFLRRDFLSILDACHQRGLVTCISTNGTLMEDDVLEFFKGRKMLYLQVSLDGGTATTNDPIRGSGTFKRIIRNIDRLSGRGIPFSINMVLTKLNFPEISSLYSLAEDYGAKLRISRFRPSGRGKNSWGSLRLEKQDLKAFSQWLSDHQDVVTGDSFFSLEDEERKGLGLNLCGAAKFTCCIDPEGGVYPCAFLQDSFFYGGNFLNRSLGDIWFHAQGFKLLRDLKVRSCESCFRFESCHGGCPAVAYFTGNTLNIPDPECLVHCIQPVS